MNWRKPQVFFRQIHHWAALLLAVPLAVMIGAGLLLMLKKDVAWIQPETVRGSATGLPAASLQALFDAARSVPQADITSWDDLDRVDFKPGKGVVKFVSHNRWEVQVDTATAEILTVNYRRSDLIESLHDGSFFAGWTKLYLFFPAGLVLLVMWGTGLYLFLLPHVKRRQKRRKRQAAQLSMTKTSY